MFLFAQALFAETSAPNPGNGLGGSRLGAILMFWAPGGGGRLYARAWDENGFREAFR
jgi:hypothetical protein